MNLFKKLFGNRAASTCCGPDCCKDGTCTCSDCSCGPECCKPKTVEKSSGCCSK